MVQFHFRICCAEEEPRGVQSFGIEVGEDGVDQLLHTAVRYGIRHALDGEQHMELRAGRLAVLLTHVVAAVVNGECDTGKSRTDIRRSDPIRGILGVVVVTVHRQTIRADEIFPAAVVIPVFGAYIVMRDSLCQTGGIGDLAFVWIGAVTWIADAICGADRERHFNTSSQSFVKYLTL